MAVCGHRKRWRDALVALVFANLRLGTERRHTMEKNTNTRYLRDKTDP